MSTATRLRHGVLAAMLLSFGSVALAALTTYSGQDLEPNQTVPPAASGNSLFARNAFEAALATKLVDGFEGTGLDQDTLPTFSLFSGAAQLTMAAPHRTLGRIENIPNLGGSFNGRFNTTLQGANWWQANTTFEVFFAQQTFAAFAFYGTDFGDFDGSLALELLDSNRTVANTISVPKSGNGANNGSLLFFGFTDGERSYSGLRFVITQLSDRTDLWDTLGFDDLTVGTLRDTPPQPAPEPGSVALVGVSLLALAAARRRAKLRS